MAFDVGTGVPSDTKDDQDEKGTRDKTLDRLMIRWGSLLPIGLLWGAPFFELAIHKKITLDVLMGCKFTTKSLSGAIVDPANPLVRVG